MSEKNSLYVEPRGDSWLMPAIVHVRPLILISVAYAASVAVYSRVPEPYCGPGCSLSLGRPLIGFLLPSAAALLHALLRLLWMRDPIRDRDARAEITYNAIMFRVIVFVLGVHAAVLTALISGLQSDVMQVLARGVPVMLGLAFVSIGNLLPRVRPNVVFGIRTARALTDRGVWMRTNRMAGYVSVSLGFAILVATCLPPRATNGFIQIAALVSSAVLLWYSWRYRHA